MKYPERVLELDVLRGWAIVLMIAFHISYDLNHFQYIDIDIHHGTFWLYSRHFIVFVFLLCMGMSLNLAHTPTIQWAKIKKRLLLLGMSALLVSLATYMVFPYSWIYFGVLHFVVLATLLGLFFLPFPRASLAVSFFMLSAYVLGYVDTQWLWESVSRNIIQLPRHTVDLVRFVPWFPVVLIGMSLVSYGYHRILLQHRFFKPSLKHNVLLAFLGKHTLVIYLIHQPIVFGTLMLFES